MKKITPERFSKLKSLFIGELIEPPKVWLTPVKEPHIFISGDGVTCQDMEWVLDYGPTPAIGVTVKQLCVENMGQEDLNIFIEGGKPWLNWSWKGKHQNGVLKSRIYLETAFHGEELDESEKQGLTCLLLIHAENSTGIRKSFPLGIKIQPHTDFPYGEFNFNGSPSPGLHDFGEISPVENNPSEMPVYSLSVSNTGARPLEVTLDECPSWMGMSVSGPRYSSGKLDLQVNPHETVSVTIAPMPSPDFSGLRSGCIICQSNDIRSENKQFELPFQYIQEIKGPYVTFEQPECIEVIPNRNYTLDLLLYNRGNTPAPIFARTRDKYISVSDTVLIPNARDREPGQGTLEMAIQADDSQAPGKHTINVELTVRNGNQEPLNIPVEIFVVRIDFSPDCFDFGTVNEKSLPVSRTMTFKSGDDRELVLKAKPLPELGDNISARIINRHTLEAVLENVLADRIAAYDGPGITVYESRTGYKNTVPVRFHRIFPVFKMEPLGIDMGEIIIGTTATRSFEIYNKGNELLYVEMRSDSPWISIKGPLSFELSPTGETAISFVFDFTKKIETEQAIKSLIIIKPLNDPDTDLAQKFIITGNVIFPIGNICPTCSLITDLKNAFCPKCGGSMDKAVPASKKDAVICAACKRRYKSKIKFCPNDGKPLKPLS